MTRKRTRKARDEKAVRAKQADKQQNADATSTETKRPAMLYDILCLIVNLTEQQWWSIRPRVARIIAQVLDGNKLPRDRGNLRVIEGGRHLSAGRSS